jgi:glycosyltransferase involved in cell wall biosynthesis
LARTIAPGGFARRDAGESLGRAIAVAQRTILLLFPGADLGQIPGSLRRHADVVRPGGIPALVRRPPPDIDRLVVAGGTPSDEIGFGLAALVAARLRPSSVVVIDTSTGRARRFALSRYLLATGPSAVVQGLTSALAVIAQRGEILALREPRDRQPREGALDRVLYVRPYVGHGTGVGGSVTHAHGVIRALTRAGIRVDAITTDRYIAATAAADPDPPCAWDVRPVHPAFRAIPASAGFGGDLALGRAARNRVEAADVIYQRHGRFALVGAALSRWSGRPLFLEVNSLETFFHAHWQDTPLTSQLAACEDAIISSASRIFVVSDVMREVLLERGVAKHRVVVTPNGVDTDRFGSARDEVLRRTMGIDPDDILVGFVGSFGPWHGAPVLARAFASAASQEPRLRLLLVGDGPERDVTQHLLEASGLNSAARFCGVVPPPEVPRHLAACDILVAPHVPLPDGTEFFGSPTKLFEYMAAGRAIVASDLGQIGHVLDSEQTAILVEAGNADALSQALVRLGRDPVARARLGTSARERARACHSWDRTAEKIIETYASLEGPQR